MERVPAAAELRDFVHRMIREARTMGDSARVDALLDKLANIEEEQAFLECVLGGDPESTTS